MTHKKTYFDLFYLSLERVIFLLQVVCVPLLMLRQLQQLLLQLLLLVLKDRSDANREAKQVNE
jgi:hypothetical protein